VAQSSCDLLVGLLVGRGFNKHDHPWCCLFLCFFVCLLISTSHMILTHNLSSSHNPAVVCLFFVGLLVLTSHTIPALVLACLLACLFVCLLVGWLVGRLVGWLASRTAVTLSLMLLLVG
jgi:hypothetical protein